MLVSDLVRAPLVALVPVLHWTGHLTFSLLVLIVFVLGIFMTPYIASQRSIIPEVLGDDEKAVAKASGMFGGAQHLPIVIGPSIAGALIGWIGTAPLLVVDGATFLFAFLVVLTLVRGGKPVADDEDSRGLMAGVRYIWRDPLLRQLQPDHDRARRRRQRDHGRRAAARVHALRPQPAHRRLDLHGVRDRCDHGLGARDEAARPVLAAEARGLRDRGGDAAALDRRRTGFLARGRRPPSCCAGSSCRS